MQVFKCAMKIIRGNIIFPIVYIIGLSFMGLFMAQSFDFGGISQTLDDKNVEYSVVDRDHSALSESISEFLDERGIKVDIDDSPIAFQDAVAKGHTDYLLIIPQGYEQEFLKAVESGTDLPNMDVVFSYYSAEGALVDEMVSSYLGIVRTLVLSEPQPDSGGSESLIESIVPKAFETMQERAEVQVFDVGAKPSEADRFVFYLQWSTYTLFAGIVVCISMLIVTMNRADVRRRNLSSPISYASYNIQQALSCAVMAIAAFAWTFALGLIAFPEAVSSISLAGLALCALSVLAYSFMALAFGFMLGQLGASSVMCNAFGNIIGMVISFLGGAWISLDLLSPEIMALAHWLPGYWYTDACQVSSHISTNGINALGTVFTDVGILALFAIAFLSIGFVAAKRRLQTSEAGGNRAAEVIQFG